MRACVRARARARVCVCVCVCFQVKVDVFQLRSVVFKSRRRHYFDDGPDDAAVRAVPRVWVDSYNHLAKFLNTSFLFFFLNRRIKDNILHV